MRTTKKRRNERPELFYADVDLAIALVGQDRLDDARLAVVAARRVRPDISVSVIRRVRPHYHPEYLDHFLDALRKAGLPEE